MNEWTSINSMIYIKIYKIIIEYEWVNELSSEQFRNGKHFPNNDLNRQYENFG